MAFCQLTYHSNALGKSVAVNIILPKANFKGPFPVFYLLHACAKLFIGHAGVNSDLAVALSTPVVAIYPKKRAA